MFFAFSAGSLISVVFFDLLPESLELSKEAGVAGRYIMLAIVFVIVVAEIYARMSYNRWFYEFTDSQLKVERGIIWKRYRIFRTREFRM